MILKSEVREIPVKVLEDFLVDTESEEDTGDIVDDVLDKMEDRGLIEDDEEDDLDGDEK